MSSLISTLLPNITVNTPSRFRSSLKTNQEKNPMCLLSRRLSNNSKRSGSIWKTSLFQLDLPEPSISLLAKNISKTYF